jgi:hypothetical protein
MLYNIKNLLVMLFHSNVVQHKKSIRDIVQHKKTISDVISL